MEIHCVSRSHYFILAPVDLTNVPNLSGDSDKRASCLMNGSFIILNVSMHVSHLLS